MKLTLTLCIALSLAGTALAQSGTRATAPLSAPPQSGSATRQAPPAQSNDSTTTYDAAPHADGANYEHAPAYYGHGCGYHAYYHHGRGYRGFYRPIPANFYYYWPSHCGYGSYPHPYRSFYGTSYGLHY